MQLFHFFPPFFPSFDYMLGLRDLNTFPIAPEFGVFVLTK